MTTTTAIGKQRRLARLFSNESGKVVLVPLDDSLLAGPTLGLEILGEKLRGIVLGRPDGIIGFKGLFLNHSKLIGGTPGILNVTASTTRSQHTRKCLIGCVEEAVQLGVEGVAAHVNIGSKHEHEMLAILGMISRDCERLGMPLLAHMYARTERGLLDDNYEKLRRSDRRAYAALVAHAARVGLEAGADLIKTQYSGDSESFRIVVEAAAPVPVVLAGGTPVAPNVMFRFAYDAMQAGAAGVSFGRNIFSRADPKLYIQGLKMIVHEGASAATAAEIFSQMLNRKRTSKPEEKFNAYKVRERKVFK
jgi:DhnA family fructose-bisphosphate aldolase class Ia